MNELLCEEALNIPAALAGKYCRGDRRLFDEIRSYCGLQLVRLARRFDPNFGGSSGREFRPWAYTQLEMAARGLRSKLRLGDERRARWHGTVSLNDELREGWERLETVGREDARPGEDAELVEWLLARLEPRHAQALRLYYLDGLPAGEVAERMGEDYRRLVYLLGVARAAARKLLEGELA